MVKSIFLQDGEEIFVDDEDYERVNKNKWYKYFRGNARTIMCKRNGKKVTLTNFILKNSFQKVKSNDFTKVNLTTTGNKMRWMRPKLTSSSKYKGVYWYKPYQKWRALIKLEGQSKHLGYFSKEDDAAKTYNQAVLDYWDGEGFINVIGKDNRKKWDNVEKMPSERGKLNEQ